MKADTIQPHSNEAPSGAAPRVSVVILNWNGASVLPTVFPSILRLDYPSIELILVDNGSTDDSVETAERLAADAGRPLLVVRHESNLGYNRGKNAGADAASGKYLWLLDNDIEPEPDALARLVEYMESHPRVGLCGPLLLNRASGDAAEGSGMLYIPGGMPLEIQKVRPSYAGDEPVAVGTIGGGTLFVRTETWRHLGGFEPSSVFSMNDVDLGPRVWCAGWGVAMVPGAVAYHHAFSRSTPRRRRWGFRQYAPGVIRSMIRNYRAANLLLSLPLFSVLVVLKALKRGWVYRDPLLPFMLLPALCKTLAQAPASLRQRRRVQALRRVPEDRFLAPQKYAHVIEEET
jgi:hypothetical protein